MRPYWLHIINNMAVDGLATQGARASAAMVLFQSQEYFWFSIQRVNTLRPRQNGCLFTADTFKRIFLNESVRISIKMSLKFVPKGAINNIPALVQIMAWRRPGDKPLSEPMVDSLLTHICVTRPQWVNTEAAGRHQLTLLMSLPFHHRSIVMWHRECALASTSLIISYYVTSSVQLEFPAR